MKKNHSFFRESSLSRWRKLYDMDSMNDQIPVGELKLSKHPIVYTREFDFREYDSEVLAKYSIQKTRYNYVGSHIQPNMNARSSQLKGLCLNHYKSREGMKKPMLGRMFPHWKAFYLNEIDSKATEEELIDKFFYGHLTYFFVDSEEEAHELETRLTNQAKLLQCLDPSNITLLIEPRRNDGSIKVKKYKNRFKLLPKKARNGAKNQPMRIDLVDQNLILDYESILNYIKYLGVKDQAEVYQLCYQLIGSQITFNHEILEIDSDNFTDIFIELLGDLKC